MPLSCGALDGFRFCCVCKPNSVIRVCCVHNFLRCVERAFDMLTNVPTAIGFFRLYVVSYNTHICFGDSQNWCFVNCRSTLDNYAVSQKRDCKRGSTKAVYRCATRLCMNDVLKSLNSYGEESDEVLCPLPLPLC